MASPYAVCSGLSALPIRPFFRAIGGCCARRYARLRVAMRKTATQSVRIRQAKTIIHMLYPPDNSMASFTDFISICEII